MSDTVSSGINSEKVTTWLETNVAGATAPFQFEFIAGGHSNLTFSVRDAKQNHYVLRRPPLSHGLASAHDMGREHRMISALQNSGVPVPRTRGLCTDVEINGAPFYVMDFVDGHIVRDVPIAETGKVGPDLTHFGSRSTIGAATLPNTRENLLAWLADPQRIKHFQTRKN